MKVKKISTVTLTVLIILSVLYLIILGIFPFYWISLAYITLVLATVFISFRLQSRSVSQVLDKLSRTICSITSETPDSQFSDLEDTMLSRLQHEILRLAEVLKGQRDRQKRQKEQITAIVSEISHQLKTPLTNLKIFSDLLQDKSSPDSQKKEYAEKLGDQIDKLNWLTERLMKMSNLEAGLIEIKKKSRSLSHAVLDGVNSLHLKAEDKSVSISLAGEKNLVCSYDRRWFTELIFNLLDNAVKYSPANSEVRITIGSFQQFAFVSVSDKAQPLSESEINKIFDRFYRGRNSGNEEGAGLGLYIARQIAEKHGGYIKVKSGIEGNIFTVYLPL